MRLFFCILSIVYISVLFLFAGSSIVSDLAALNPYSLLHIPLYGIMVLLLFFSLAPSKYTSICQWHDKKGTTSFGIRKYSLMAGIIAIGVAIADEYHQSFIPNRTASVGDVLLDAVGIGLCLLLIPRISRILSCSRAAS